MPSKRCTRASSAEYWCAKSGATWNPNHDGQVTDAWSDFRALLREINETVKAEFADELGALDKELQQFNKRLTKTRGRSFLVPGSVRTEVQHPNRRLGHRALKARAGGSEAQLDARNLGHAELARGEHPAMAGQDAVVAVEQQRVGEPLQRQRAGARPNRRDRSGGGAEDRRRAPGCGPTPGRCALRPPVAISPARGLWGTTRRCGARPSRRKRGARADRAAGGRLVDPSSHSPLIMLEDDKDRSAPLIATRSAYSASSVRRGISIIVSCAAQGSIIQGAHAVGLLDDKVAPKRGSKASLSRKITDSERARAEAFASLPTEREAEPPQR